MKINFILIFFVYIFLFIACKKEETFFSDNIISLDKNELYKSYKTSDILDSVSLVLLETKDECLIGSPSKVIVDNNYIYIIDKKTSSVFLFNREGKYINKINRLGRGPGEYIIIDDFCLLPNNRSILLDGEKKKIIVFDSLQQFKEEQFLSFFPDAVESLNDSVLVFNGASFDDRVIVWDLKQKKVLNSFIPYNVKYSGRLLKPLIKYKDKVYFQPVYSSYIYKITENKILPAWHIDFGEHTIKEKDLIKTQWGFYANLPHTADYYYFTENDDAVFFSFNCKNLLEYSLFFFYSKKTGKQIILDSDKYIDDMTFYGPPPRMEDISSEGIFFESLYPYVLLQNISELENNNLDKEMREKLDEFKKRIGGLTEYSNPIIAFYHIKDF